MSIIKPGSDKKWKWFLLIPILLILCGIYLYTGGGNETSDIQVETRQEFSSEEERSAEDQGESSQPVYIYVDVSGAVNTPTVVCIPSGSRVFEAIDAAGGRRSDAYVRDLNLASVCEDGQKIYVPNREEAEMAAEQGQAVPGTEPEPAASSGTVTSNDSGKDANDAGGKVNINTAGSEELQTLTGVGPAIASRIIDYRNTNGAFQSIDDLMNITGIGEKTLSKFRDQICVS